MEDKKDNARKLNEMRARKIAILGQHLAEMMVGAVVAGNCDCPEHQKGAVDDSALDWEDAVYSAGMAVKALSMVAQLAAERKGDVKTPEEITAAFNEILKKALSDERLQVMRFNSRAEFEAFAQQANGHHGAH